MNDLSLRFERARSVLCDFINESYDTEVRDSGFEYFATADAPSTYEELCDAFEVCVSTGKLPVYNGGMSRTVYHGDSENLKFRFLHDLKHVRMAAPFTMQGEYDVAMDTIVELRAYLEYYYGDDFLPLCRDTLLLLWIDTIGQVDYYYANDGAFVDDQLEFAWNQFILRADV